MGTMVYMNNDDYVTLRVKPETRRKIKIIAAKRSEEMDETINYLIDFEYERQKK